MHIQNKLSSFSQRHEEIDLSLYCCLCILLPPSCSSAWKNYKLQHCDSWNCIQSLFKMKNELQNKNLPCNLLYRKYRQGSRKVKSWVSLMLNHSNLAIKMMRESFRMCIMRHLVLSRGYFIVQSLADCPFVPN